MREERGVVRKCIASNPKVIGAYRRACCFKAGKLGGVVSSQAGICFVLNRDDLGKLIKLV
jgi:hypothetical protein